MHHIPAAELLRGRAEAALEAADADPFLDGLIGWYAMEASYLTAESSYGADLAGFVATLAGSDPDIRLYPGYTARTLAAAGVMRATAGSGVSQAA